MFARGKRERKRRNWKERDRNRKHMKSSGMEKEADTQTFRQIHVMETKGRTGGGEAIKVEVREGGRISGPLFPIIIRGTRGIPSFSSSSHLGYNKVIGTHIRRTCYPKHFPDNRRSTKSPAYSHPLACTPK